MFSLCWNLTSIDLSNFNSKNVNNLIGLFDECEKLNFIDISNLDTSQVTG